MQYVIAPWIGERALGDRVCVDELPQQPNEILGVFTLVLEMTGAVGLLVLLFAAQAVMTVWIGCAWGTRSVGRMMTPAGRTALMSLCSWRRAIHVFYLGTTSKRTSFQASWSLSPDRALIRAEASAPPSSASRTPIVDFRRKKAIPVVPKRLLVLTGDPLAADPANRTGGTGNAAELEIPISLA
jgi:hypothetical protein